VFVIMLSDQPYAAVFGPSSTAPYLSHTLEHEGELLVRYYAVAHEELANGAALISGQGPTPETAANCPTYTDIAPATLAAGQQVIGKGCVYPRPTHTLVGQLTEKHLAWRAYIEGMDEAGAQGPACGHPAPGQTDPTVVQPPSGQANPAGAQAPPGQANPPSAQTPPGEAYTTFRNPFVYFHSVIDSPACAADDVGLNRLSSDLADPARTPSFSYIAPDRCHDGNPTPCAAGQPAGLPAADGFLKKVVPQILGSKAYKDGGLLVVTVDEAPSRGEFGDSSSCCGQPHFPNMAASAEGGPATGLARGGGEVGALLLSPFVKPATTSQEPYNHFSLLRTVEDLFALKHLGYAGSAGVSAFEPSLFQASKAG
jgi:phosphatidylinositol-3-phosphatase